MQFCPQCQSALQKTTKSADIIFICRQCGKQLPGTNDDTLMSAEYYEAVEHVGIHLKFIEQAAHDPAANIVLKDCPQCQLDFMTMVRIGDSATTIYTCTCGYVGTHNEYLKANAASTRVARTAAEPRVGPSTAEPRVGPSKAEPHTET